VQLQGSTALLTGATGGIGRAVAHALDARGAHLLVSGRRAERLEELRRQLDGRVESLPADLAEPGAVQRLAERAGAVDVLVANAGLPGTGRVDDFAPDEIDRALDVNLRAPIQLTRALLPGMLERRRGHVVLVSSLSGKVASLRSAIYSATKFGLRGFAAGLREDLHGSGVGVTVVYPGFVSEAGMFADSGAKPPPGLGTTTPDRVGAAVVRAIEQDKMELTVAPMQQRIVTHLAMASPSVGLAIQSGGYGRRAAEDATVGERKQ
jgi:short-subunit dehydrogenase